LKNFRGSEAIQEYKSILYSYVALKAIKYIGFWNCRQVSGPVTATEFSTSFSTNCLPFSTNCLPVLVIATE